MIWVAFAIIRFNNNSRGTLDFVVTFFFLFWDCTWRFFFCTEFILFRGEGGFASCSSTYIGRSNVFFLLRGFLLSLSYSTLRTKLEASVEVRTYDSLNIALRKRQDSSQHFTLTGFCICG